VLVFVVLFLSPVDRSSERECFHVSMFPGFHVSRFPCFHVSMFPCFHVSMFQCFHFSMFPFFNVSIFQCFRTILYGEFKYVKVPCTSVNFLYVFLCFFTKCSSVRGKYLMVWGEYQLFISIVCASVQKIETGASKLAILQTFLSPLALLHQFN
jgi:hypothetical protein